LLENNPFMGSLDPAPYTNKLAELYEFVKSNMPQSVKEAHQVALEGTDGDEELIREADHAAFAAAIAEADTLMEESAGDLTDAQQEYCNKVQALRFTQSALEFIDIFEEATVALEGMLLSTNTSDVTEALRFFVRARHFKLPCAVSGMKRALALMWSTEQNIRDEVLKAFVDVFIAVPGTEGERLLPNEEIAENLLVLASEASVSEQASIEEAIVRLVHEERLPPDVFLILWSIVSKGSGEARVAAIQLLSMGAASDRTIVDSKSRLKLLLDNCLGKYTQENNDWKLAGAAALALQRVRRAKVDPSDAKFLVLEQIMEQLCDVARGDWCRDDNADDTLEWFSASEQAIKALFVISPEPEVASRDIILNLYSTTFPDGGTSCHSLRLARFFHVLGNVALNLLVYTEALSSSVRRANAKKTLAMQEEADKAKAQKGSTEADGDNEEEEAIEAELGMAAELEAETERKMAEISENEILGRGVISHFYPLLVRVVQNEGGKFNSEILMQASTLALCKLMCVSSSFCEKHLPLLFTSLASAPPEDTTMTANIVVALGDLAFRFPNEVEPYTPRIYACLQDSSTKVRRHTLMVLTHLILNDMVKVKGQVCAIAMCLRDKDPRIRDSKSLS
jgi:condensin complex subunit 1